MVLDIVQFRAEKGGDPDVVRESQRRRHADVGLVDQVVDFDKVWRDGTTEHSKKKGELGQLNKEIGMRKKKKEEVPAEMMNQQKDLKAEIAKLEEDIAKAFEDRETAKGKIGNLVHESVPVSNDEANNEILRTWGTITRGEDWKGHPHHQLLHMIGGADMKRGSNVAGHRGYFLQGPALFLQLALQQYGLRFLNEREYTPMLAPYFMKKEVMAKTAQLSQFDEELYNVTAKHSKPDGTIKEEEYYLIATSEQPISAFHSGEWLEPKDLPMRYAGTSACFRKEAGSHGRDVWGIYRVHQFDKVEQFCITSPEDGASWKMLDSMVETAEAFYQSLGLAYRLVAIVSGALNDAAAKKIDLEAFFPFFNECKELVSCSNCTDYQSRALGVRYRGKGNDKQWVHMLNGTLCASTRSICCILENNQTEEGVKVPDVLVPFVPIGKNTGFVKKENGDVIIPFVNEPMVFEEEKKKKGKK